MSYIKTIGSITTALAAGLLGLLLPAAVPAVPTAGGPPPLRLAPIPTAASALASPEAPLSTAACETQFQLACYEPAQIQDAYHEDSLFSHGITGRGETIAIVDAFGSPTIAADLKKFDNIFKLPAAALQIIAPAGAIPPYDPSDPTMVAWANETTLDVEWAHVIAPGAGLLLVETPQAESEGTAGFAAIVTAENYVIDHGMAGVISQSFSVTEPTLPTLSQLAPYRTAYENAAAHNVTVLAASGDQGATGPSNPAQTEYFTHPVTTWPPSDPLVTGVGGTELHLGKYGFRTSPDTVWNDGYNSHLDQLFYGTPGPVALASGGGVSTLFKVPWYQAKYSGLHERSVPDVSMSAGCDGAVEIYASYPGVNPGWYLDCGTSEAVPLFAGIVALADQKAGHLIGPINRYLYRLSAQHAQGIKDITQGNNTVTFTQDGQQVTVPGAKARPGYDTDSGVGTVSALWFVPELARMSDKS